MFFHSCVTEFLRLYTKHSFDVEMIVEGIDDDESFFDFINTKKVNVLLVTSL